STAGSIPASATADRAAAHATETSMKASVLFEQGAPLRVEELDLEGPREGEVLVRMVASGVCHSCLHAADGSWKGVPVPIVLGDEGAGVVEDVGPGVDELQPGDHVILSWAPTCGRCHYCVIGRPNLCERRQPGRGVLPDGTTRMSLQGRPVYHYGHVATYASRTVVHESCAIAVDKNVPLDRAALIGCSVLTGVPETGATVPLDVRPIVTAERVVRGCSYGSARTREDLPRLATLYLAGKLKIDQLITRRYALDEANEAFRALAGGELARGLIVF